MVDIDKTKVPNGHKKEKAEKGKQEDKRNEKEDESEKGKSPSVFQVLGLSRPEWPVIALSFLFTLVSECQSLANPVILADAYNAVVDPKLSNSQKYSIVRSRLLLVIALHLGKE